MRWRFNIVIVSKNMDSLWSFYKTLNIVLCNFFLLTHCHLLLQLVCQSSPFFTSYFKYNSLYPVFLFHLLLHCLSLIPEFSHLQHIPPPQLSVSGVLMFKCYSLHIPVADSSACLMAFPSSSRQVAGFTI